MCVLCVCVCGVFECMYVCVCVCVCAFAVASCIVLLMYCSLNIIPLLPLLAQLGSRVFSC